MREVYDFLRQGLSQQKEMGVPPIGCSWTE